MDIDFHDESDESAAGTNENGFQLYPVSIFKGGEGLPYAPIDWPNPGDVWRWRVGKRIAASGHYLDRYLYLPSRLRPGGPKRFQSKLSVEQYLRRAFPGADVNAFFASFSWKIPSEMLSGTGGVEDGVAIAAVPYRNTAEQSESDSQFETVKCKAGNKMCSSLVEATNPSEAMFCDICCSEPDFCRDCCCILCCKTINSAHGGYSFITCEAMVVEGIICGHLAHVECGLRSYMAGTVGGSIGLDAEYYCRRCDAKTDLISHVTKLLKICESIDSRHDMEKILNVGICILRGSKKTNARRLLHHIEFALAKLKSGTCVRDIWKMEDISAVTAGEMCDHVDDAVEVVSTYEEPLDHILAMPKTLSGNFDHRIESLKLEDKVDQILQALKKSQDLEYKIAEDTIYAQKDYLLNLYQQLDKERSDLSGHTSSTDPGALLDAVLQRADQIKREVMKLKDMEEVAKGFGRTSKDILKEHFGLEM